MACRFTALLGIRRRTVKRHMFPPVEKNGKAVNWLLMGVFGEAHVKRKSSECRCVRFSVGSDALRWIFGRERAKDSNDAKIYSKNEKFILLPRYTSLRISLGGGRREEGGFKIKWDL